MEVWRRSWGSGHSHSSCSLQSNTTNTGSGTGKDDFWAALQTNYNYIMDTKLIESCKEARGEIEGSVLPDLVDEVDCCKKVSENFNFFLQTLNFCFSSQFFNHPDHVDLD